MKTAVVSFYMLNMPDEIVRAQEQVVRRFLPEGFQFFQILTGVGHGASIDSFLRSTAYDVIIFLDIDCIPLTLGSFSLLADEATPDQLVGGAHRANHIDNGGHLYAGPFFCGVNRALYNDLGAPSARSVRGRDVAEEFTYACEAQGKSVKLWWPTSVETPRWKLTDDIGFGIGTTYENQFWHLFESRTDTNRARFIAKCAEILAQAAHA
jgi:hypothetical protein